MILLKLDSKLNSYYVNGFSVLWCSTWISEVSCMTSCPMIPLPVCGPWCTLPSNTGTTKATNSVQFSRSVVSGSLWRHGLQHARLPCPSPTLGACQTHDHQVGGAIQPSHLTSPPPPAFNRSQHQSLFKWVSSHQVATSIGVSASASILPMNIQVWFPLGWTRWISLHSKGLTRVFNTTVQKHQFFGVQCSL